MTMNAPRFGIVGGGRTRNKLCLFGIGLQNKHPVLSHRGSSTRLKHNDRPIRLA
jgi:hypothetical protein